jgi:hypothetical protein
VSVFPFHAFRLVRSRTVPLCVPKKKRYVWWGSVPPASVRHIRDPQLLSTSWRAILGNCGFNRSGLFVSSQKVLCYDEMTKTTSP